MMHNALRSFIRESIMLSKHQLLKESDEMDVDDAAESNLKFGNVIDKRFSLTRDGEPAFTVIADNKDQSKIIIIPYPQDRQLLDDRGANLTQETLIDELNASRIPIRSSIIKAILNDASGWTTSETHKAEISSNLKFCIDQGYEVFPDILIMSRDLDLLQRPKAASTRSAVEAGKKFECALQPREIVYSIFDIRDLKKLREPEWLLNAACYYEYANSIKGALLSGLVMGALAWLATAETGPFSIGAFISAAGIGSTSHDIVMRVPVIAWAAANGKTKFLAANVAYIVLVLIFESLVHFKEVKGVLKAGEVIGVENAASSSGNVIAKMISSKLEGTPGMTRLAKNEFSKILDGIFSHAYDASDARVTEKFFANAVTAAQRLDFWTPMKLCIVGFCLQFVAFMFGDTAVAQFKSEFESLANADFDLNALESSKSELMSDINALSTKYPPM
jgi:hypothetical protein